MLCYKHCPILIFTCKNSLWRVGGKIVNIKSYITLQVTGAGNLFHKKHVPKRMICIDLVERILLLFFTICFSVCVFNSTSAFPYLKGLS